MIADQARWRMLRSPARQAHHSALPGRRTVAATEPMPVLESSTAIHIGPAGLARPSSPRSALSSRRCRPKIFSMSNSSQNSRYLLIAFLYPLFVETVQACNTPDHLQILAAHLNRLFIGSAASQSRNVPGSPEDQPSLDTFSEARIDYGFFGTTGL
jgi:hypothetical protein